MSTQFRIVLTVVFGILFAALGTYFILKLQGFVFNPTTMSFSRTGGISLHVTPRDVTFLIDNEIVTESPSIIQDMLFINDLLPGRHHITGKKDGYTPWEKYVLVTSGFVHETIEARLWPESIPSSSLPLSFASPNQRFFPTRYGVLYEFATESVRLNRAPLKGTIIISLSLHFDRVITASSRTFFYTNLRSPASALNINDLSSLLFLRSSFPPPTSPLSQVFFDPVDDNRLILLFESSLYSLDIVDQTISEITPTFGAKILPKLSQVFEEYFFGINTEGRLVTVNTLKGDVSILPLSYLVSDFEVLSESSILFLTPNNELYLFSFVNQTSSLLSNDVATYSISPDKTKLLTLSLRHTGSLFFLDQNTSSLYERFRPYPLLFHSGDPITSLSFFSPFHFLFMRGGLLYIGEADAERFSNVALVGKDAKQYEFFENRVYVLSTFKDREILSTFSLK